MIHSYKDAMEYIFSKLPMFSRTGPSALRYDLGNIVKMCRHLDDPHKKFPSVHIAGTNGKGTSSHLIASVFQEAGYKTGLYTSPHYKDFRERIKTDGKFIRKKFIKDFIISNYYFIEEIKPSYFELSVALAFSYFASMKVDIAIIEVGLGGRLDSTNIITPLLSLITNISYDHVGVLGDTLVKIAGEKAGIIKNKIPVVIGEKQNECKDVFEEKASVEKSPVFFADDLVEINRLNSKIDKAELAIIFENKTFVLNSGLSGPFIGNNIKYAVASILVFREFYRKRFNLSDVAILNGIQSVRKNTGYFGRWRILGKNPLIIADGAHNIDAIEKTMNYISSFAFGKIHIILGVVADKDWEKALKIMPDNAVYYFTKAGIPRAMEADQLQQKAFQSGLKGMSYQRLSDAMDSARSNAEKEDLILIIGSIYLVGEI